MAAGVPGGAKGASGTKAAPGLPGCAVLGAASAPQLILRSAAVVAKEKGGQGLKKQVKRYSIAWGQMRDGWYCMNAMQPKCAPTDVLPPHHIH